MKQKPEDKKFFFYFLLLWSLQSLRNQGQKFHEILCLQLESAGVYWRTDFEVLWPPSNFHQAKEEGEEKGRVSFFPFPFIYPNF